MKCMYAQTRPRFILSSERVFGGMEFEPMLTPRDTKSLIPVYFILCFSAAIALCSHCSSALLVHSPAFSPYPSSTDTITRSQNVTTCMVTYARISPRLFPHLYCLVGCLSMIVWTHAVLGCPMCMFYILVFALVQRS